jgi:adhesin/invasin
LTLGAVGGANTVRASSGSLQAVTFTATALKPNALGIVSGNSQSATVGNPLAGPLVVGVTDQYGDALPGVTVNFAVTGGTGSLSATSPVTDASGRAQSELTLGTTAGTVTVTASVSGIVTPETFTATARAGPPAAVAVASGNNQSAVVGNPPANPLAAKVTDQYGNPVSGVTVSFAVTGGSGSPSAPTAVTTTNGQAQVNLTLGTTAGAVTVNASVAGVTTPAVFTATATPGAPASVTVVSGNNQSGTLGATLANPLVVKVSDQHGNLVAGATVNFAVTGGSGNLSSATAVTGANGQAQVDLALGALAGVVTVTATVSGVSTPAVFTATAAGTAASIVIVSGNNQFGVAGSVLSAPLIVKVSDQNGNPVPRVIVTFTITAGNGTLDSGSATTAENGQAQASLTLATTAGAVAIAASVSGVSATASFTATAIAGLPASLVIDSGNNQVGAAGSLLPNPLVVKLTDRYGNPVAGVTILFTVASGAGSLNATSLPTDSSGRAQVTWRLGSIGADHSVHASAGTLPAVTFTATATVGIPAQLTIVGGNNQRAVAGSTLSLPLIVRVTDQGGNVVPGVVVSFAVTGGGGSLSPATAMTGGDGQAAVNWTLGPVEGSNTAQASVTGLQPASFSAVGTVGTVPVGSIAPAAATAAPGGTARVRVTLTLNSGVSLDSLAFGLRVDPNNQAPAVSDPLTFVKDASVSDTSITANAGPNFIGVGWLDLPTLIDGAPRLGEVLVPIPALATDGQTYTVRIIGTSASRAMVGMALSPGPDATISVVGRSYLIGDAFPIGSDRNSDNDKDDAGEFGDDILDILDLIYALRAVTSVPGYRPPACSDRFDAMDSHTAGNGAGVLNTVDLIYTLRRVILADETRPRRYTRNLPCTAGAGPELVAQAMPSGEPAARLELGLPQAAEGGALRVPVYLEAARDLELAGLSFSLGMTGLQPGTWNLEPGTAPPPTLIDTDVPGVLAVAWLEGLQVAAGQRLLLGYVEIAGAEAGRLPAATLQFHGISANAPDGSEVRVSPPTPREQM